MLYEVITIRFHLIADVQDVAQHREQMLLDAADDLAIDEGRLRGIEQFEFDPPFAADDIDVESAESFSYNFV